MLHFIFRGIALASITQAVLFFCEKHFYGCHSSPARAFSRCLSNQPLPYMHKASLPPFFLIFLYYPLSFRFLAYICNYVSSASTEVFALSPPKEGTALPA